eukprot:COSAG06_NODE_361_length_16829_cov_8.781112_15_plen_380_part_01
MTLLLAAAALHDDEQQQEEEEEENEEARAASPADELAHDGHHYHYAQRAGASASALAKDLPRLRIDPNRIISQGSSSGGDMAVQFHVGFSKRVKGVCGYDTQPWRCAATRFQRDVMLPQTAESSTPHCYGCGPNETILYDHCKSHVGFVNATQLAHAAMVVPACGSNTSSTGSSEGGGGSTDCIDDVANIRTAKIFLTRGECHTYTGSAVENTQDVYQLLGASNGIKYFDQCNPDGSHRSNDTTLMCLEHVFGPSLSSSSSSAGQQQQQASVAKAENNFLFPQAPFLTDYNVGFAEYGFVYIPTACANLSKTCGLQVRFHGCGSASPADATTQAFAEANAIVLLDPNVLGEDGLKDLSGNNASVSCNAGTAVEGNCKEIS